ncbi:MAG: hypothetical protein LUG90_09045 [Clostridiaceae bacterium]|nr:hypothetical protein [Clostridiaceae bacterium]
MLNDYQSLCQPQAKVVVSRDSGAKRTHRAINADEDFVRHYRIDGDVIRDKTIRKCDFLLLNDTKKNAYLIEVKGTDLLSSVAQLENTEKILKEDLRDYQKKLRIVYRSNTHAVTSTEFKRFCFRHGGNVIARTDLLEEYI